MSSSSTPPELDLPSPGDSFEATDLAISIPFWPRRGALSLSRGSVTNERSRSQSFKSQLAVVKGRGGEEALATGAQGRKSPRSPREGRRLEENLELVGRHDNRQTCLGRPLPLPVAVSVRPSICRSRAFEFRL